MAGSLVWCHGIDRQPRYQRFAVKNRSTHLPSGAALGSGLSSDGLIGRTSPNLLSQAFKAWRSCEWQPRQLSLQESNLAFSEGSLRSDYRAGFMPHEFGVITKHLGHNYRGCIGLDAAGGNAAFFLVVYLFFTVFRITKCAPEAVPGMPLSQAGSSEAGRVLRQPKRLRALHPASTALAMSWAKTRSLPGVFSPRTGPSQKEQREWCVCPLDPPWSYQAIGRIPGA